MLREFKEARFDYTMVFAGVETAEGEDRKTLDWPGSKDVIHLINEFSSTGKVVFLFTSTGPTLLKEVKEMADAIVFNVMPGEQYGKAIINVLMGRSVPSAKLSFTLPNKDNE